MLVLVATNQPQGERDASGPYVRACPRPCRWDRGARLDETMRFPVARSVVAQLQSDDLAASFNTHSGRTDPANRRQPGPLGARGVRRLITDCVGGRGRHASKRKVEGGT